MEEVGCFLKFGKRMHLERLHYGYVYFSTAEAIAKIEQETAKRGVGDSLEGGIYLADITQDGAGTPSNCKLKLEFEPAMSLPLFCLFMCKPDEVKEIDTNHYFLDIPEKTVKWFQDNFMDYDSVAIISNPSLFASDMVTSLGINCIHQKVNYVNKDATQHGRPIHPIQALIDISCSPIVHDGSWSRSFYVDDAYKLLFQKDEYFSCEREYRFVLKDREFDSPREIKISSRAPIQIIGIDELLCKTPIKNS